jgi:hypothetical protein
MKNYLLIFIILINPFYLISQSVGVLGKLAVGHENPAVDLDVRSNINEVRLNLRPKGLDDPFGYTLSKLKFFTDTISEEGYSIGYFKDPILFPPITIKEFRINLSNALGEEDLKMAFGLNYINVGKTGEKFNMFSKAVVKNDLELDNSSIIFFNDNSQQSTAAGTKVESNIIQPASSSFKSFLFPQGSSSSPPTSVESTIYYDTIQSEFLYFDGAFWRKLNEDNDWSMVANGYANLGSRFVIGGINPSSQRKFSVFSTTEKETGYFRNNGSDVVAGDTYGMRSENYHQTNGTKYGIYGYSSSDGGGQKIGVYGGTLSNTGIPHYGGFFEALGSNAVGVYGEASETANANYGGLFKSRGLNGIGVYGEAIGTTASNHGGYFKANGLGGQGVRAEALGVSGTGLYATGSLLAAEFEGDVKATGDIEIIAPINDAILSMKTATGTIGRILQKQNNTEDVYIGDITGGNSIC